MRSQWAARLQPRPLEVRQARASALAQALAQAQLQQRQHRKTQAAGWQISVLRVQLQVQLRREPKKTPHRKTRVAS